MISFVRPYYTHLPGLEPPEFYLKNSGGVSWLDNRYGEIMVVNRQYKIPVPGDPWKMTPRGGATENLSNTCSGIVTE